MRGAEQRTHVGRGAAHRVERSLFPNLSTIPRGDIELERRAFGKVKYIRYHSIHALSTDY